LSLFSLRLLLLLCFLLSLLEHSLLGLEVELLLTAVIVEPLLDMFLSLLLVDVVSRGRKMFIKIFEERDNVSLALSVISLESLSKFATEPVSLHRL